RLQRRRAGNRLGAAGRAGEAHRRLDRGPEVGRRRPVGRGYAPDALVAAVKGPRVKPSGGVAPTFGARFRGAVAWTGRCSRLIELRQCPAPARRETLPHRIRPGSSGGYPGRLHPGGGRISTRKTTCVITKSCSWSIRTRASRCPP